MTEAPHVSASRQKNSVSKREIREANEHGKTDMNKQKANGEEPMFRLLSVE